MHLHVYSIAMVKDVPCVAQTLRAAARMITRKYEEALRPVCLTSSQYTILHALNSFQAVGPTELGEALAFEQTTATRLLAKLETQGLITFVPHAKDARRRLATLTELGRERYAEAVPLWQNVQDNTLSNATPEEWQALRNALKQISQS